MRLIEAAKQTLRTQGCVALMGKGLRYVLLRLRLYVWLPLAYRLGIPTPLRLPDRTFLERDVFGWLAAQPQVKRVLFAGIESYTWHYFRLLPGADFYTIDFAPKQAKWARNGGRKGGRKGFHTVGSVTELAAYYPAESFDVVILNGLIGWGLDTEAEIELSFTQAHKVLKPGGILIVGWPNEPKYIDFTLEKLAGYQLFEPLVVTELGLQGHRVEVSPWRRHTFDFLRKG